MGAFLSIIYNRLVTVCAVKTGIEVQHSCVPTSRNVTFVGFLRFPASFLFVCAATNRAI